MASTKYKLMFGGNPDNEVSLGFLEKGNAVIKGPETKTKFRKGNVVFPNRTEGWGQRLVKGKDGKDAPAAERIDASHKEYNGKIKWMKWGDEGGYPIEARYKAGSSSLDYQYQITRLGMKKMEEDLENNYLQYASGYQEFDLESDGILCEFLRIYFLNEDSESKNPNSENSLFMFKEVKEFNSQEYAAKEVDLSFDAVKYVKEANSMEKLKVFKMVLSKITDITYNVAEENSLYESLILYASKQSKKFLDAVEQYKKQVSELIELGKAYDAIDCTLDGTIVVLIPKKEILIEDVDAKGENMLQWLFDNCLEPRVFEAIEKLNLYSQKFKS